MTDQTQTILDMQDQIWRLAEANTALEKLRLEDLLAFESTQIRRDEENLQLKRQLEEVIETLEGIAGTTAGSDCNDRAREQLKELGR